MKKLNLREEIHKIQDGIENVHGDVAYGERQYLFLFKEWAMKCIGGDLDELVQRRWAYRLHSRLGENPDNKPDIKVWIEDNEYARGWNDRSKRFRQNIQKITME